MIHKVFVWGVPHLDGHELGPLKAPSRTKVHGGLQKIGDKQVAPQAQIQQPHKHERGRH